MNKARHTAEENDNDKFEEMLEQDQRDEAMRENQEYEKDNVTRDEEDNPAWDMTESDYL